MSLPSFFYSLLIEPLAFLLEAVFSAAFYNVYNVGLAILYMSIFMNLLLLPLYRRTDAIQAEAMETERQMKPCLRHIRKTFHGNEQFMMIKTCYRQHHYSPADSLKGIVPLVLEIPFFMAAYHFLSALPLLKNIAWGPIADLSRPDQLLKLGSISLNLLPVLMTVINILSSLLYTRNAPVKAKLQLYGMAAVFLILLYDCPSGLVLYWTMNNLFSLIKNLLARLKDPLRLMAMAGTPVSFLYPILVISSGSLQEKYINILFFSLLLNLPLFLLWKRNHRKDKKAFVLSPWDHGFYLCGCCMMTVLLGMLIPSALIASSPQEFMAVQHSGSPLNPYVFKTTVLAAGFFLVWGSILYLLADSYQKKHMQTGIWLLSFLSLINYLFFGRNYGTLSNWLIYDRPIQNTQADLLFNLLILLLFAVLFFLLIRKKASLMNTAGISVLAVCIGISTVSICSSQKIISEKAQQLKGTESIHYRNLFSLSKEGKNVVILMLDRAINAYFPYILNEIPELQQQFAGFTYYPNTFSFGPCTNIGLPSVFGGYEYTPLRMNLRDSVSLEEKHNEAMRVLPVLFDNNGYRVTVCDPTYAGYDFIPDLSIYADHPGIQTHITMGRNYENQQFIGIDLIPRRVLFHSIMKTLPLFLQEPLYREGTYLCAPGRHVNSYQEMTDTLHAEGISIAFDGIYNVLRDLPHLTEIRQDDSNTFMMMCNDTTHTPTLLQMPHYSSSRIVDNSQFSEPFPVKKDGNGNEIRLKTVDQITHYHCNAAAYVQIGHWLDFLRKNHVYDNTRILIVSDHARALGVLPSTAGSPFENADHSIDITSYNPILLVKDFGSQEFKTDETLMTNAEVPFLSAYGLMENPVNPETGNPLQSRRNAPEPAYIFTSTDWNPQKNCGSVFLPGDWFCFDGRNISHAEDWKFQGTGTLPQGFSEHSLPHSPGY